MLGLLFGAKAQFVVGLIFLVTWLGQWAYWGVIEPDAATVKVVFHVSMEAGVFAAYGVIATALGFRATERVEQHVEQQVNVSD